MLSERQLRAAMKRGLPVIVGTAILSGAAATGASVVVAPQYVASQALAVQPPPIRGSAVSDASQSRLLSTNSALLTSESVLEQAGVFAGTTGKSLQSRLSVETDTNSDLLTLSVEAEEAGRAESELAAVIEAAKETEVATERARITAAVVEVQRQVDSTGIGSGDDQAVDPAALEAARAQLSAALASLTSSMQEVASPVVREASRTPEPPVAAIAGAVAGLVLGAALVVIRTRYRARVLGPDDVRPLGVAVLSGPDESLSQAARRINNVARRDEARFGPVVLVHLDAPTLALDKAVLAQSRVRCEELRVIEVRPDVIGGSNARPGGDSTESWLTVDEDAVFSPAFRQEVTAAEAAGVLVSVAGSDSVVFRASTVVGASIVAVRQGAPLESLRRILDGLTQSNVTVLGVVIMGKRSVTPPARTVGRGGIEVPRATELAGRA
jgi:hypothetical protein